MLFVGDPRADMEYERQLQQHTYIVPEPIKNFLNYFQKVVTDQNTYEIGMAYESGLVHMIVVYNLRPWQIS